MTPLPCPCGRGMRAVLRDHAGNPVRLADRCKTCSGEAIRAADASPPGPARERATALIDALNKDGGGHVVHGALQAAMIAEANASDAARTPPRTLPVTAYDRATATVLRAYVEQTKAMGGALVATALDAVGDAFVRYGLLAVARNLTPAGAALLARVEADRSAEDIARELVVKLQTSGAPGLVVSDAQSLLADVRREVARQARLAGTTPIDAPPAKEPR